MKILIVEDDRELRAVLYDFLSSAKHDVMAVSDAVHAVALLTDTGHDIDLVLLDLNMPRLNGKAIIENFADWSICNTRFIIMSGFIRADEIKPHPKLAGILLKPFPLNALSALIEKEIECGLEKIVVT